MKERLRYWYDKFFVQRKPLPPGIYHYQSVDASNAPIRMHLRIEPDGSGILIINARTVLHLNQTATEYAYHMVQKTPDAQIIKIIRDRYVVTDTQAAQDLNEFRARLQTLLQTPDLDPETFLNMERADPYSKSVSAPYRMDCALTYRSNGENSKQSAPWDRVRRELLTEEWKTILQKMWEIGIPHVVFTGGEPTLRPDLPDLIRSAESLGMVSGILTDGLRLSEPKYLHELLTSGLDHIMIVLDPREDQAWEALRDTLAEDIFVTVHLTINYENQWDISQQIERLATLGVKSVSLSSADASLRKVVKEASDQVNTLQMSLTWDLPVPYSSLNPVTLEAPDEQFIYSGAGNGWLYVEPDGDVVRSQGDKNVIGNLLTDPWSKIWNNRW